MSKSDTDRVVARLKRERERDKIAAEKSLDFWYPGWRTGTYSSDEARAYKDGYRQAVNDLRLAARSRTSEGRTNT